MADPGTHNFDLGDILSITNDRLVAPRGIAGVVDILNFMTGESLFTHQLPHVGREAKTVLLLQHPQLADVDAEAVNKDNWQQWLLEQKQRFGDTLPVAPIDDKERAARIQTMRPRFGVAQIQELDRLRAENERLRAAWWAYKKPKKEARMTDKTEAVPSIVQARDFLRYCEQNPEQRFWQALRNWAGVPYIGVSNDRQQWVDTFHFTDDVARRYTMEEREKEMTAEDRRMDGELETEIIRLRAENERLNELLQMSYPEHMAEIDRLRAENERLWTARAGWQLVPKEPTPQMIGAIFGYPAGERRYAGEVKPETQVIATETSVAIYKAMLAAAPRPEDGHG